MNKCAPRGTITAVYLNSVLFHGVLCRMHRIVNSSLDDIQYANTSWIFWQGGLKNSSACGMSEHKEEFMMWRNKAGRNHWKHLTHKLRACFCQREEGMTNVSDRCLGQFFHLNKSDFDISPPLPKKCQGQFVKLQRIKAALCLDNSSWLCT